MKNGHGYREATPLQHVQPPPAGEVQWTVWRRESGEKVTVAAQTWFAARDVGARLLGCLRDEADAEMVER